MAERTGRGRKKNPVTEKSLAYRTLGYSDNGRGIEKPLPTTTSRKSLQLAASKMNGSIEMFVEYVRMGSVENPEVIPFLELWDSQPETTRRRSTLDEFAHLSNVKADKILSVAAGAAFRYNADVSDMMAMAALPDIVEASINSGKGPGDYAWKDREMIMKHSRFLPVPQGNTINIANTNQAAVVATGSAGIPDFSDFVKETTDTVRDSWSPEDE